MALATALDANTMAVTEGSKKNKKVKLVFTVTLSQKVSKKVTIQYTTANGTALVGTDYLAKHGS